MDHGCRRYGGRDGRSARSGERQAAPSSMTTHLHQPQDQAYVPLKLESDKDGLPRSTGHGAKVGLLRAQSPWLRKDGVCIGIFQENSEVTIVGRVQLRVLVGLVHCSGYIFKPSSKWHELFVPLSLKQPSISLSPLSPSLQDPEFSEYFAPFRSQKGVHFHSSSSLGEGVLCSDHDGCAVIDLEGKDLCLLNQLAKGQWVKMVSVVLLKPLTTPFVQLLRSFMPSTTLASGQWIDGLQTVHPGTAMEIPDFYKNVAWDLAKLTGVSLLVCGPVDIGKSSLCRYLTNYFLNRWPVVCYIECDVGQTEFTVSGVVALHLLTEPVLGPPMSHLRRPAKAYYFGASTPAGNPEHYYRAVRGLQRHLAKVVRPAHPNIPVVINTCGWVRDMGFSLLLDFIRLFSPSHIVQFLDPNPHDTSSHLTPMLLTWFSGIYSRPETSGGGALTMDYAAAQVERAQIEEEEEEEEEEGEVIDDDTKMEKDEAMEVQLLVEEDSDEQQASASEEEIDEESSSDDRSFTSDDIPLMTVGRHSHDRFGGVAPSTLDTWIPILSHKLFKTLGRRIVYHTSSSAKVLLRQLMTLSYFSPLLGPAEAVAREQGVAPDAHSNILFLALPLEIPWSDVAIHIVNCQVPRSQALYAVNGRVVALGQVHSKEIVSCEIDSPGVGVVKFLKSNDPLIEFLGLGLVRAIDTVQQKYYVTTPLSLTPDLLDRVNVLAVGKCDILPSLLKNTVTSQKTT